MRCCVMPKAGPLPHCIDRFLEAQDDGLDIPECLRRY
jgi:hypothetical protein